jgi:hypothetical protein
LGPIALELSGRSLLCLALDEVFPATAFLSHSRPPQGESDGLLDLQSLFPFQGLSSLFAFPPEGLEIYAPSAIASLQLAKAPHVYIVAFGLPLIQFIVPKKPLSSTAHLKALGYAFGDRLSPALHPQIIYRT